MCLVRTYETRGRGVLDPAPRRSNFGPQPASGIVRMPVKYRRSESFSDEERYIEYRYVHHSPSLLFVFDVALFTFARTRVHGICCFVLT